MKKILLTLFTVFIMTAYTVNVYGQTASTANASAGARLIVPMTLTEKNSLDFGTSIIQSGMEGSVVLSASDSSRDFNGGVSGSLTGTPASNAVFIISGTPKSTFALTLPTSIIVVEPGAMSMSINDLKVLFTVTSENVDVENNTSISSVLGDEGTASFRLGGKLNIGSGQVSGVYSGSYAVSVDYN
jgi:hypothetical protein